MLFQGFSGPGGNIDSKPPDITVGREDCHMKNVYVVTHTESIHHTENRVGGWYDTRLTERGRAQAQRVASRLEDLVDHRTLALTCSDLLRAKETSEIIAVHHGCPVETSTDLRELSYGIAEGKPQSWLDTRFEPAPNANRLDHRSIENGETKREFLTRIYRAVDRIIANPATNHVVVTHGYAMTFVVARWIGLPLEQAGFVNFKSTSGGITHLQEDDFLRNRTVRSLNDTSHLVDA